MRVGGGPLRRAGAAAAVVAVALALAGCEDGPQGLDLPTTQPTASSPATTPSPTPTGTPLTEEQQIIAQYQQFWAVQTPASQAAGEARLDLLREVTVDPALSRIARGMTAADLLGEVAYGEVITHPEITSIADGTASIRDCLDAGQAGRQKKSTGEKTTVGTARDLAETTMLRGEDGIWRVSMVDLDFPAGSC